MSQKPRHLLTRAITAPKFDLMMARVACWFVSGLVLVLGISKLSLLPLSEGELFLGVLLVTNLSLMCCLIGLVLPLVVRAENKSSLEDR